MGGDVGVGVALEAPGLVGPGETGQVHGDPVDQAVDVGTDADANGKGAVRHDQIMPEPQSTP
ncbi:hypothetical protein GCM10009844_04430 [Nocardioides koreensis]|uniref:Uncharacterized protein n=1 Tax=Nocardioides koreensis TaxID=433651 RepID=A0ABN2Z661_9ACTN